MLVAWCLLREAFRTFEVPRIETLVIGDTSFRPRRVQLLRDYVVLRTAEWKQRDKPSPGDAATRDAKCPIDRVIERLP